MTKCTSQILFYHSQRVYSYCHHRLLLHNVLHANAWRNQVLFQVRITVEERHKMHACYCFWVYFLR